MLAGAVESNQFGILGGPAEDSSTQPLGTITFDGTSYRYTGFVLDVVVRDQDHYSQRSYTCTPGEIGVEPTCDPDRVRAMMDAVGANRQRQLEIRVFGKRVWHCPYRHEPACEQALDWAFGHDVALVALVAPLVERFFQRDPTRADNWTRDLRQAFLSRRSDPLRLRRVLLRANIPPERIDVVL